MKTPVIADDFWSHVAIAKDANECWEWTRAKCKSARPYGQVLFSGRVQRAHRVAYELVFGSIGDSKILVCHRCDNPPCCNPRHLFLGSHKDNTQDMIGKGRRGVRTRPSGFKAKPLYGTANKNTHLTETQVREIRDLYARGDVPQRQLGAKFGIGKTQVARIVHRHHWNHVV